MKIIAKHAARPRGFSLVEVALSIAIVAIVVLAVVGLLVPAQRTIDEVLTSGQAGRLRQEVENEFSVLRQGQNTGAVTTPFAKAYEAVKNSKTANGLYYAFFYRAKQTATNSAGRLEPFPGDVRAMRAGVDYVVQAAVMRADEFQATPAYGEALEGRLFLLRFTPIEGVVADPTAASPFEALPAYTGSGTPLADFITGKDSTKYPLAVIPVTAEFYAARDLDNPAGLLAAIDKGTVKPLLALNVGFNR
jgi:prepilin-type N-terminal cleavage/methylation domain-containing protein